MRRILLSVGVASAAAFVLGTAGSALHQGNAGPTSFVILNAGGDPGVPAWKGVHHMPLPYDYRALEPHIDEETLRIHHGKHHAKYVENANALIKGTEMESWNVVDILRAAHGKNQALFNNAGQSFNHEFYWNCMKPNGGGVPSGRIAEEINKSFGNYQNFRTQFIQAGMSAFGSGWAWLVWTPSGQLKIVNTIGAESPLTERGSVPLLTMDVWEHAYYLKYRNMRATYCDTFVDHLINWEFVEAQLPSKDHK